MNETRMRVGGRPATVQFFDTALQPVDREHATMARIVFDDRRAPIVVDLKDDDGQKAR